MLNCNWNCNYGDGADRFRHDAKRLIVGRLKSQITDGHGRPHPQ
ncbi:hypothetical protein ABIA35_000547 [Catenulispora sp. MAP12-49]